MTSPFKRGQKPTLSVENVTGAEDGQIGLDITAAPVMAGDSLEIIIDGLPTGSSLSAGVLGADGSWSVSASELPGLTLTPPAGFTGSITLTVQALETAAGGYQAVSSAGFSAKVNAAAEAPTLTVQAAVGNEGAAIGLTITAVQAATDLSASNLSVTVSGLQGATLNQGTLNADGSYTLTAAELAGLTLTPASGFVGSLALQVTATDTEASSDTTASSAAEALDVTVNPVAETPSLTVQAASGAEGAPIALTITAAQAATDLAAADLTVTISGLQGATLNQGTLNGDGSYTLTLSQLSGLTLTPPSGFSGALDLTVTATDTETTSGTSASAAPQTLTVTVASSSAAGNPVLTAALFDDTGVSATDGITSDPTISGAFTDTQPIVSLTAGLDGAAVANFTDLTADVGSGGSFTITAAQMNALAGGSLADGAHTLNLIATDSSGATASATVAFTLETTPPTSPVFDIPAADLSGSGQTQASQVDLIGTTTPGAIVSLDGTNLSTIANTAGAFDLSGVNLALGSNSLVLDVENAAGVFGTASQPLTVTRVAAGGAVNPVIEWDEITLNAITKDADAPTVASRALAMESVAVYDAISAIDGTPGFLIKVSAASDSNADAAVIEAADVVLDSLYPGQAAGFDAQAASDLAAIADGQAKTDGIAAGLAAAEAVIAARANDGSQVVETYDGGTDVGQWRPTGPMFLPALTPQYADVTPWAMTSSDEFLPPPPPDMSSAEYAADVMETESLGQSDSTTRTAAETQQALWWNDQTGTYTPAGEWNNIADSLAQAQGDSLTTDAQMLAELNVAEGDAGIAAWNAKYTYGAWRPITAIQNANEIGNSGITQVDNWQPLLTTPNFPEYVAGHAVFSAAAAQVLDNFFGANTPFTATSPSLPGVTLSFTSFDEAAEAAGMSRVYGGIHFLFSVQGGETVGQEVGANAVAAFNDSTDTTPPMIVLTQTSGHLWSPSITLGRL